MYFASYGFPFSRQLFLIHVQGRAQVILHCHQRHIGEGEADIPEQTSQSPR